MRGRISHHVARNPVAVVAISLAVGFVAGASLIFFNSSRQSVQDAPPRDPIAVAREFGLVPLDEFDSHVCNYMHSAEDGLPDAQWNMGRAYENGRWGVTKHDQVSAQWYRLAAEQGHAGAQERLGYAYAAGRGVVEDDVRAYMWLTLAVSRHLSSTPRLTQAFRDMLGGRFSPSQLATAQQLAQDWRPLTFEEAREVQPLPDAQMSLVECPPK